MIQLALLQMTSVLDCEANLAKVESAAYQCRKDGIRYLFLPECFYSMSDGTKASPHLVQENNDHFERIKSVAQKYGVALLGGSAATLAEGNVVNRAYNFNSKGENLGFYDKRKLFACDLGKGKKITEADIYSSGSSAKLIACDDLNIGLGICFDVRFPHLAWSYREQRANMLTYSSAFTVPTGKAHWHTLLRARAIETQCFVVACAQYGENNERIKTYGHSLVVDPWGEILLDAKEGEGLHYCAINLSDVEKVRGRIKIL